MANSQSMPQFQSQTTASQTASSDAGEAESTWLHAAWGKVVRIRLRDGKWLTGQLLAFDAHTLVIQGSAQVPFLVYKHSINYLGVDEPATES